MATYTTPRTPAQQTDDAGPARRVSPALLVALALAVAAFAAWWYAQREAGQPLATEPAPVAAPAAGTPEPATAARGAEPAASARPSSRPAPADRAPRPLAGNPLPEYPRSALRAGAEGGVVLSIVVGSDGTPTDVQVVRRTGTRDRAFDRAAIEAARQWRFEPAVRDGETVPATVQLPIEFRRS